MLAHLEDYRTWLKQQDYSPNTVRDYGTKAAQLDRYLVPPRAFDLPGLRGFRDHLRDEKALRPRTIRLAFVVIANYARFLVDTGRASKESLPNLEAVEMPALDTAKRDVPTDDEMAAMLQAALSLPDHREHLCYVKHRGLAMFHLLVYCGLRRSELLALRVADLRRKESPWQLVIRCGKGQQPNWMPIHEDAEPVLSQWLELRAAWCAKHGHTSDALFPVDKSRRLSNRGFESWWMELRSLAGVRRRITAHGIRHWAGSRIERREGLEAARRFLRHRSLETTFLYLKGDQESLQRAVDSISLTRPAEGRRVDDSHRRDPKRGSRLVRQVSSGSQRMVRR